MISAPRFLERQGRAGDGIKLLEAGSALLVREDGEDASAVRKETADFSRIRGKGNTLEFVQSELTALRERAENRLKVTKINRTSTEEQLNARRKGVPHKSKVKVKSADVARENREKRDKAEGARKKMAEMAMEDKKEDPDKYDEQLDQGCNSINIL